MSPKVVTTTSGRGPSDLEEWRTNEIIYLTGGPEGLLIPVENVSSGSGRTVKRVGKGSVKRTVKTTEMKQIILGN